MLGVAVTLLIGGAWAACPPGYTGDIVASTDLCPHLFSSCENGVPLNNQRPCPPGQAVQILGLKAECGAPEKVKGCVAEPKSVAAVVPVDVPQCAGKAGLVAQNASESCPVLIFSCAQPISALRCPAGHIFKAGQCVADVLYLDCAERKMPNMIIAEERNDNGDPEDADVPSMIEAVEVKDAPAKFLAGNDKKDEDLNVCKLAPNGNYKKEVCTTVTISCLNGEEV